MDKLPKMELSVKSADFLAGKLHSTSRDSIDGVIRTDTYIVARVPFGAALADYDITDLCDLAAKKFDAKTFGLRIAA